jgi:uncharacterized protein with PIN domain
MYTVGAKERIKLFLELKDFMKTKHTKLSEVLMAARDRSNVTSKLTMNEYYAGLQSVGFKVSKDELEKVLKTFDSDVRGQVDCDEFTKSVQSVGIYGKGKASRNFTCFEDIIDHISKKVEEDGERVNLG